MRKILWVLACAAISCSIPVAAQTGRHPDLPPQAVDAVDQLYPGFLEILESHDTFALARLADTLSTSRAREAAPVLAWILEHRPALDPEKSAIALINIVRATSAVPVPPLLRALRDGNPDQRRAAAIVLVESRPLFPDAERPAIEKALIEALGDPSVDVRIRVAMTLRGLGTSAATAALAASVDRTDVSSEYYWSAMGVGRPRGADGGPEFDADLVRRVDAVAPGFVDALQRGEEPPVRQVIQALAPLRTPDAAVVLTWILANGDAKVYGGWVARLLVENQQSTGGAPVLQISELLVRADPDHRFAAATFFDQLFSQRQPRIAAPDRAKALQALTSAVMDRDINVSRVVVSALGRARARDSVPALVAALDRKDASRWYLTTVFNALWSIADGRAVLALERWAREPRDQELRGTATRVAINLGKPANRSAAVRRLLWEQPDTDLEREVLVRGKVALPRAWQALGGAVVSDKRGAAALLGWFRDVRSVPHLLAAFDATHGAVTRQQLLFDLNAILLTEAPPLNDTTTVDTVAAQHLRQLLRDLHSNSPNNAPPPCAGGFVVYPREVSASFRAADSPSPAFVANSASAFDEWLKQTKAGCGIAFHPVQAAGGVARVASTFFQSGGAIHAISWNTLHRRTESAWVSMPLPATDLRPPAFNRPNFAPAINRNYGALDPLRVVRFELLMRRIELRSEQREYLRMENADVHEDAAPIDRMYLPLLERYRTSNNPNVRYVAELEIARLTGVPDVRAMIDGVERQPEGQLRQDLLAVLSNHMRQQFKSHSSAPTAAEQTELVNALMTATGRDVPPYTSRTHHITAVKKWTGFGLVEVASGPGPSAESGYSALFERRGNRWAFICVISSWIA